ncbi:MAG: hypothetical protein PHW25_13110 [Zoogloea sp.]|uniref:hypothetical protein n=1 Tax=Zoogloea sp. TaxID=49181 RepID=UPI0026299258|nr:hypothetical protein [Zoogloea sp.]MDD3328012.1 hypothetical protein [Zoogloea sp.]
MRKPVIVFAALVALYVFITAMGWNLSGLVLTLLLLAGIVLAPFRAFQALAGRLAGASGARPQDLRGVSILFLLALLFWGAMIWATVQIELLHRCSGDTCIGYMLLALPFPFVYGLAEVLLFKVRKSRPTSPLPGGTGKA